MYDNVIFGQVFYMDEPPRDGRVYSPKTQNPESESKGASPVCTCIEYPTGFL